MALDKWIAVFFLAFSMVYGYAAYSYALLPFEVNMSFHPNTLPKGLSGLGIILSLIMILSPKKQTDGVKPGDFDVSNLREYKIGQALGLICAMIIYAIALRPVGFIAATTIFLIGTGWILGERRLHIMIISALIGTLSIWYLVQETLGIYLKPHPWFMT